MPKHGYFTPSRFKDAMTDSNKVGSYRGYIGDKEIRTSGGIVYFDDKQVVEVGPQAEVVKALGKWLPDMTQKDVKEALIPEKGIGETAIDYAHQVAMERLGVYMPDVTAPALEHGLIYEDAAVEAYELQTFAEVERVLEPLVLNEYVAGTPDGLIGTEGIIEVKCPWNPKNHLFNLVSGEQVDQYTPQMQGYMWITGAKWCDFISYDPRYPENLQTKIIRVERDQAYIDRLAERIEYLNTIATGIVEGLTPPQPQG